MEIPETNIFVLALKDNRFFVFGSQYEDKIAKIKRECELLYDFPKKYNPLFVIERFTSRSIFDINSVVLQYMYKYGIYNVRGGIYQNIELNNEELTEIYNQFKLIKNMNIDTMARDFIYEINNKTDKELRELLIKIEDKYSKLKENEKKAYELKEILFENSTVLQDYNLEKIDYYLIEKIQQFKEILSEYRNTSNIQEVIDNYSKNSYQELIDILLKLYKINELHMCVSNLNQLPNIVFDNLFYNRKYIESTDSFVYFIPTNEDIEYSLKVCEDYETILYWTLNRLNEYEFDMFSLKKEGIEKKLDILLYTI